MNETENIMPLVEAIRRKQHKYRMQSLYRQTQTDTVPGVHKYWVVWFRLMLFQERTQSCSLAVLYVCWNTVLYADLLSLNNLWFQLFLEQIYHEIA